MSDKSGPPTSTKELLTRYEAGERDFSLPEIPLQPAMREGMTLDFFYEWYKAREEGRVPGTDRKVREPRESDGRPHLVAPDLRDRDLREVDLANVDMPEADLRGANLAGANLSGTWLGYSKLAGADLRGVDFTSTPLHESDLSGADLRGAVLREANLTNTDLRGADLREADLTDAHLFEADLRGADLRDAALRAQNIVDTRFEKAVFGGTDLRGVDLSQAKGLAKAKHEGPSRLDEAALKASRGKLPKTFLKGCSSEAHDTSKKLKKERRRRRKLALEDRPDVAKILETLRPVTLLQPRRAEGLDPGAAKMGGRPDLRGFEDWPGCPECGVPLKFLVQIPGDAFEETGWWLPSDRIFLAFESRCDHLGHYELQWFLEPLGERGSDENTAPPEEALQEAPLECRFDPRQAREIPHPHQLQEHPDFTELGEVLEAFEEEAEPKMVRRFHESYGHIAGTKLNGWPSFEQWPEFPECSCGRTMRQALQIDSKEKDPEGEEWWSTVQSPHGSTFADMGTYHLFACEECGAGSLAGSFACG